MNSHWRKEYDIYWYAGEDDASKSYACLTPELVTQFGLKEDVAKNLQWSHDAKCLKSGQLEGMEIKADLSQSALVISLPQAYLNILIPTGIRLHVGMTASRDRRGLQHQRTNPARRKWR
ncbi:FimD/PapC N-terminal domain-containing protein [Escherichia coli]